MSKNADPNGCPGTVLGDCDPVCARCGRDMGAEMERVRAAPETSDPDAEPSIGSVVLDGEGTAWQRSEDGYWRTPTGRSNGWKYMTATFGPVALLRVES